MFSCLWLQPGYIIYLIDITFRFWQRVTDWSRANISLLHGTSDIVTIELTFAPVSVADLEEANHKVAVT
jgi:hypothetical protein